MEKQKFKGVIVKYVDFLTTSAKKKFWVQTPEETKYYGWGDCPQEYKDAITNKTEVEFEYYLSDDGQWRNITTKKTVEQKPNVNTQSKPESVSEPQKQPDDKQILHKILENQNIPKISIGQVEKRVMRPPASQYEKLEVKEYHCVMHIPVQLNVTKEQLVNLMDMAKDVIVDAQTKDGVESYKVKKERLT